MASSDELRREIPNFFLEQAIRQKLTSHLNLKRNLQGDQKIDLVQHFRSSWQNLEVGSGKACTSALLEIGLLLSRRERTYQVCILLGNI